MFVTDPCCAHGSYYMISQCHKLFFCCRLFFSLYHLCHCYCKCLSYSVVFQSYGKLLIRTAKIDIKWIIKCCSLTENNLSAMPLRKKRVFARLFQHIFPRVHINFERRVTPMLLKIHWDNHKLAALSYTTNRHINYTPIPGLFIIYLHKLHIPQTNCCFGRLLFRA